MSNSFLTLYEVQQQIKQHLHETFRLPVSVVAEIGEMTLHRRGHCYLELVEKDLYADRILARMRATIWASSWRLISAYFASVAGQELGRGMKVLLTASVEYHEQYGLSLNVIDIDPAYTVGDLARRRQEIIRQLTEEGIFDMNRELPLPTVVQRLAVISSPQAAGYGDFVDQLRSNPQGYWFHIELFEAVMQGDTAVGSILDVLERIVSDMEKFDAVVLIRGGGAKADLQCFDSCELATHLAQFPLPVITGIGHERDESVADLVANISLKTPTAVAEWLIARAAVFDGELERLNARIIQETTRLLSIRHLQIERIAARLPAAAQLLLSQARRRLHEAATMAAHATTGYFRDETNRLNTCLLRLNIHCRRYLGQEALRLDFLAKRLNRESLQYIRRLQDTLALHEKRALNQDPARLLERGYSITRCKGKIVKYADELTPDDEIHTLLNKGSIRAVVRSVSPHKDSTHSD